MGHAPKVRCDNVNYDNSECLKLIILSDIWAPVLKSQPETGMGYQIASVHLKNGRQFDGVMIIEGRITSIKNDPKIPFTESEIEKIIVTHAR